VLARKDERRWIIKLFNFSDSSTSCRTLIGPTKIGTSWQSQKRDSHPETGAYHSSSTLPVPGGWLNGGAYKKRFPVCRSLTRVQIDFPDEGLLDDMAKKIVCESGWGGARRWGLPLRAEIDGHSPQGLRLNDGEFGAPHPPLWSQDELLVLHFVMMIFRAVPIWRTIDGLLRFYCASYLRLDVPKRGVHKNKYPAV